MWAAWAFVVGASVGSFLGLVADRLPRGLSLVRPRSLCMGCERPLDPIDMVPVLSYLWLRGRCRRCGARIPVKLLLTEVIAGALFAIACLQLGIGPAFFIVASAIAVLLLVALIDLEHKLILNVIVYPSVAALLLLAPFWGTLGLPRTFFGRDAMLGSALNSLSAGLGGFAFFGLVFLIAQWVYRNDEEIKGEGFGLGDVNLAVLIGLLAGFPGAVVALWVGSLAGGLVAIALLAFGKKDRKDRIPYGPFLVLGAIVALLAGNDIMAAYWGLGQWFAEILA